MPRFMPSVYEGYMRGTQTRLQSEAGDRAETMQSAQIEAMQRQQNTAEAKARKDTTGKRLKSQMLSGDKGAANAYMQFDPTGFMETQEWMGKEEKSAAEAERAAIEDAYGPNTFDAINAFKEGDLVGFGKSIENIYGANPEGAMELKTKLLSNVVGELSVFENDEEFNAAADSMREGLGLLDVPDNVIQAAIDQPTAKGGSAVLSRFMSGEDDIPTGDFVVYEKPDGTTENVNEATRDGQALLAANPDWVKAPTKTQDVPVGKFIGSKTDFSKYKTAEVASKDAMYAFSKVVNTIKETPDAGMSGGKIASTFAGLKDELISAYSSLGFDTPETVLDMANYSELLSVHDEVYRGQVFDAALAYAAAIGLGEGRALTDKDVERALRRMGKNWGTSKAARMAVLEDVGDTLINKHKNRYDAWHNDEYKGDFGDDYRSLFGKEGKVAGLVATRKLGNRGIATQDGKWVYVDTGEIVE